jgi:hypothetical protein
MVRILRASSKPDYHVGFMKDPRKSGGFGDEERVVEERGREEMAWGRPAGRPWNGHP